MEKKLYRDEHQKTIGGVCAGLAGYFCVDISIIRAIFLLTLILKGTGLVVYIVLWIVLPKKGYGFYNPGVDYRVPPREPFDTFGSNAPKPGACFDNSAIGNPPKKQTSTAGLIIGCVLILVGASFLLNELDILPFWNMARLWPVTFVIGGAALMVSGQKKQPWEKGNWQDAGKTADTETKEELKDNTPTV